MLQIKPQDPTCNGELDCAELRLSPRVAIKFYLGADGELWHCDHENVEGRASHGTDAHDHLHEHSRSDDIGGRQHETQPATQPDIMQQVAFVVK
eukprot:COSAG02_NODE_11194_length_1773_cov_1.493429_3_plen_94_part_00